MMNVGGLPEAQPMPTKIKRSGRSRQGAPLLASQRMALRIARWSFGGRPMWRFGRSGSNLPYSRLVSSRPSIVHSPVADGRILPLGIREVHHSPIADREVWDDPFLR
jgi:hypothetical protein